MLLSDTSFAMLQNTFSLNIENSKNKVAFKVNPYINHYQNKELETGLRQAYLDIFFSSMDIRIGKQQIIWGKADGVFITDVISPKDMREFLLPDFDEIRMGVTALKVDYYLGNNTFEFVFVPAFTPTKLPEQDSIWNPNMDFNIQPIFDYSQKEVAQSLNNSEVFLKFSVLSTSQLTSLKITPQHHRLGLFGGSFSTTVGSFIIRGESACYCGKYFQTLDPMVLDSVIEKNYIHYLIGADFTLAGITMSTQFIQQVILNYDDHISRDQFENTMTFLAQRDFLRETLFLELFAYIGLNKGDSLVRLKATYKLVDGFEILLGANIFSGREGRFGQYNDNDMLYMKVKYSF